MILLYIGMGVGLAALIFGLPAGFAFALAALITIWFGGHVFFSSPSFVGHMTYFKLDVFAWMAIPLFLLMGNLMKGGGLALRLIDFCKVFIGKVRGGLMITMLLTTAIFGAMCGSSTAACAGLTPVFVPELEKQGYKRETALAFVMVGSILASLIPPSLVIIIFCTVSGVSVVPAFLSPVGTAILLIVCVALYNRFFGLRHHVSESDTSNANTDTEDVWLWQNWALAGRRLRRGILPLLVPVAVLGSIYGGIATPTEAAAIGVMGAIIVGLVLRELKGGTLIEVTRESSFTTAAIFLLIGVCGPLGQVFEVNDVSGKVAQLLASISPNPYIQILVINFIGLFFGMFMESTALQILLIPILFPAVLAAGIDPLHFAGFWCLNVNIGCITPPFGYILFAGARVAGVSVDRAVKELLPLIGLCIVVMLISTYYPPICNWLPHALGYHA